MVVERNELHVAWLGDSQALLVRDKQPIKLVTPHKPEDEVRLCTLHVSKAKKLSLLLLLLTRGQSNLTKSASRGPIPRLGVTPGGRKLYH